MHLSSREEMDLNLETEKMTGRHAILHKQGMRYLYEIISFETFS